jgi:hypothetical protein
MIKDEVVTKDCFSVIASKAKQYKIFVINGLLRTVSPRNDGFTTFETASFFCEFQ